MSMLGLSAGEITYVNSSLLPAAKRPTPEEWAKKVDSKASKGETNEAAWPDGLNLPDLNVSDVLRAPCIKWQTIRYVPGPMIVNPALVSRPTPVFRACVGG